MLHENHEYDVYTLDKINNEATTSYSCIQVEYYIPVLFTGACRNYLMPGHVKQIISLLLFSLMLKPILINQRPTAHQQPGHCHGRPRSAGTYGIIIYGNYINFKFK